jgi:hypothetical protein
MQPDQAEPKKKRGRPRMNPEMEDMAKDVGHLDYHSDRRHIQNCLHGLHARLVILKAQDPNRFVWLVDSPEAIKAGTATGDFRKRTIMSELGRIDDDDDLLSIAEQVCELKPNTQDAVAMIRRWRLGKSPEADALGLTDAIVNVINRYIGTHPGTTKMQVRAACDNAADYWSEEEAGEG